MAKAAKDAEVVLRRFVHSPPLSVLTSCCAPLFSNLADPSKGTRAPGSKKRNSHGLRINVLLFCCTIYVFTMQTLARRENGILPLEAHIAACEYRILKTNRKCFESRHSRGAIGFRGPMYISTNRRVPNSERMLLVKSFGKVGFRDR